MTALAAVERTPTLADLADTANREHEAARAAGMSMLEHAIRAGEALTAAREQCGEGNWRQWLAENFDATPFTASTYIRIAHQRDALEDAGRTSVGAALAYLREQGLTGPFRAGGGYGNAHDEEVREEARRLCNEEGRDTREVARLLGVSRQSVRRWVDPTYARVAQQMTERARAERRAAAKKKAEQAAARKAARAARKAGGGIAKAYSLAESMQDALGRARNEATDNEARAALHRAGEHYRKMRDEIVRALGVS